MQTAEEFIKQQINTEYYNLIISGLHDRENLNLSLADETTLGEIEKKNEKVHDFFNTNMMMNLRSDKFDRSKQVQHS